MQHDQCTLVELFLYLASGSHMCSDADFVILICELLLNLV